MVDDVKLDSTYTYVTGSKDQNDVTCSVCNGTIAAIEDGVRNTKYRYTCIPCAKRVGILW